MTFVKINDQIINLDHVALIRWRPFSVRTAPAGQPLTGSDLVISLAGPDHDIVIPDGPEAVALWVDATERCAKLRHVELRQAE
jgi:hypothetical protein